MYIEKQPDCFKITLTEHECYLLFACLHQVAAHYAMPPGELPPSIGDAWYQYRYLAQSGIRGDDGIEWRNHLREHKTGNLPKIETWLRHLQTETFPLDFVLPSVECDAFLSAINDHRLFRAAQHNIGEEEMELNLHDCVDPEQQIVLLEIHFLATLIDGILGTLFPHPMQSPEEGDQALESEEP